MNGLVFFSIWNPGGLAHGTTITYRADEPGRPLEKAIERILRLWAEAA